MSNREVIRELVGVTENRRKFGELLKEAVHELSRCLGQPVGFIQRDLAQELGRTDSAIEYWGRGYIPEDLKHVEILAREIVKRERRCGRLGREWLYAFLVTGGYSRDHADGICGELFPGAVIGTTPMISVQQTEARQSIELGKHYFFIKMSDAQAAYLGRDWAELKRWQAITSVDEPELFAVPAQILVEREVRPGNTEKLSGTTMLVKCLPAAMQQVSVNVDYQGPPTRLPLLKFRGDFNLADPKKLQTGFYAILGTVDEKHPLPSEAEWSKLEVRDKLLLFDGQPIRNFSYVVMEVISSPARTPFLDRNASWNKKFQAAERLANDVAHKLIEKSLTKGEAWQQCCMLLHEARLLLQDDPYYFSWEAESIYKEVATRCQGLIQEGGQDVARSLTSYTGRATATPELVADLADLGLNAEEDLAATLQEYAQKVAQARRILRREGLV